MPLTEKQERRLKFLQDKKRNARIAFLQAKKAKFERFQQFQRFQQSNISLTADEERARLFREQAAETGAFESFAIGAGRGLTDIGRAVGLAAPEDPVVQESLAELERQRPITQTIGRATGQAAPFAIPGLGIGALASTPARIAASAALGGAEGAAIAAGTGEGDIAETAGVGAAIGGAVELAFPILGRLGSSLFRQIRGKSPKGSLFDVGGKPSPEFQKALDDSGITIDELTDDAQDLLKSLPPGVDPAQAERAARFRSQGLLATKGDITQEFSQQVQEARLLESSADLLGDPVRSLRLRQSERITENLEQIIPELGVSKNLGDQIKSALTGRKTLLKESKNTLYKLAARQADELNGLSKLPVFSDTISDAVPNQRLFSRISRITGNQAPALRGLLAEFGIDNSDESLRILQRQNVSPQQLNLSNFDEFRVALGQIENSDPTRSTSVLIGPIREALDLEAENLASILQKEGITNRNILDPLLAARTEVRKIKTEFSPQSVTGRLIGTKRDRITPIIESSRVFDEIVGTNKPIEFLERTVEILRKSGASGKQALDDLQAATITQLIESSFKAQGRKINGVPLFNTTAFNNKLRQIGDKKLKLIFAGNAQGFRTLKQISRTTKDIRPSDSAIPKGSANAILDVLRKLRIFNISPGVQILAEGLKSLSDKSTRRKILDRTLDPSLDVKKQMTFIKDLTPSLAVALGLNILDEDENNISGNQ